MHEYGFLQATVHSLHRQLRLLIEPHRQQQLPVPKLALAETLRGNKNGFLEQNPRSYN
jgi:plasmid maintenance system killer protein